MNFLLDYFFPITSIEPTPAASTAWLRQLCVVVKPKSGQEGNVGEFYTCTTASQVAARTDNLDVREALNAGMSKVIILLSNHLDIGEYLVGHTNDFYTILISSDFLDADIELAKADGIATITSYANLVSGTDDIITVGDTAFTAQATAAVLGDPTFQALTSNDLTAASLAAQINAHPVAKTKVIATVIGSIVTITALENGALGNLIVLAYTDGDANVGATISGVTGGKLDGGAGLMLGTFTGVVGMASTDDVKNKSRGAVSNQVGFHTTSDSKAKNLVYAFGKLLGNVLSWKNQQYVEMPYADDVDELGEANSLFDDKISFVMEDAEFGIRLGLFAQGSKAITAPYIKKNLQIDMQSAALTYVTANQPDYTPVQASLIEDELQKVINLYIARQWISSGTVQVKLEQSNFVASGYINISEPKALWRIAAEMQQTL